MTTAVLAHSRYRRIWRAPDDQPAWARPALLAIAAVAAVLYAWGIGSQIPHVYYAAAVRSMSMSWHNFFFAAFDPDATISVDKLPGALWVQALSVRIFGPHTWAYLLPQVVAGVLTILVLYRAVRRLATPTAGLITAAVAALTPATVALNRGNISDTLLILLLVLAADQVAATIASGRTRNLMYAGLFVGLAFQTKMVQAWFVIPALAAAVLITAPRSELRQRITATVLFGLVALVVSLSWLTVVQVLPAEHRPYIDGSQHNSLFEQVFLYNAASRANDSFNVGAASFATSAASGTSYRAALVIGPNERFDHIFGGVGGREIGWLVPLALLCLVALALRARRGPRTDPATGALVLWGGWLLIHIAAFLTIGTVNPYYLAALTPALAALIGMGATAFVEAAGDRRMRGLGLLAGAITIAYAWWLLAPAPPGIRWATTISALVLGIAALLRRTTALLLAAVLAAPAVASVSLLVNNDGALDTPFESAQARQVTHGFLGSSLKAADKVLNDLHKQPHSERYPLLTYTSALAAPFITVSGTEIPSIGGFTGEAPVPTTEQIARLIAGGQVGLVLIAPADDSRVHWIRQHCKELRPGGNGPAVLAYYCGRR
ncbi:ArnT family glycosyltransferase [Nocardia arthritidis]|uniref:Mannosyl transferase n=1 Tax=Nocardia arthritidis TaxID=228602 RepID=A0A6G9YDQ4_9NOCA|nr:glycosyltransferase family 39 protein [Nocardia arthritidis]QIS11308.1 mannosyl transferase [Nocardia arthritidis]